MYIKVNLRVCSLCCSLPYARSQFSVDLDKIWRVASLCPADGQNKGSAEGPREATNRKKTVISGVCGRLTGFELPVLLNFDTTDSLMTGPPVPRPVVLLIVSL